MLTIRFVKKVLKRIIKDKEDNLVRLRFDLGYASKLYNRDRIQEIDRKLIAFRNNLTTEKNRKFRDRDKGLVIKIEAEIPRLEGEMREFKELSSRIVKTVELIAQSEGIIEALKKVVGDKEELKKLTYGNNTPKQG